MSARNPDLSVIIVTWNTRGPLRRCLDSLCLYADGLTLEVIVVDNASSDGSQLMLGADYPWVISIENDRNIGFARANNVGAVRSSAPLLLLLNSDAAVLPGALRTAVAYMESCPRVVIAGLQLRNDDLTLQPSGRRFPSLISTIIGLLPLPIDRRVAFEMRRNARDYAVSGPVDEVSGAAMMIRRSAFVQLGGFDECFYFFGEDVDLCWRAKRIGGETAYIASAAAIHSWGGARAHTPPLRQALLSQRAQYVLLLRHRAAWQAGILRILLVFLSVARLARGAIRPRGRPTGTRSSLHLLVREVLWLLRGED